MTGRWCSHWTPFLSTLVLSLLFTEVALADLPAPSSWRPLSNVPGCGQGLALSLMVIGATWGGWRAYQWRKQRRRLSMVSDSAESDHPAPALELYS